MSCGGVYFGSLKSTPRRVEASIFLRDVVFSRMLHLLKFLEAVLPPADPDYMSSETSAHKDWDKTVSYLQETLCPGWWLTLRMMADLRTGKSKRWDQAFVLCRPRQAHGLPITCRTLSRAGLNCLVILFGGGRIWTTRPVIVEWTDLSFMS